MAAVAGPQKPQPLAARDRDRSAKKMAGRRVTTARQRVNISGREAPAAACSGAGRCHAEAFSTDWVPSSITSWSWLVDELGRKFAMPADWSTDLVATKAAFDRDGYVALPGFLDAAEVAELRDEFARFREAVLPRLPREEVFYEKLGDESTLKQVQRLHEHDAFFGRMMTAGKFRRVAEIVLGESVTCRNMQYFNKPPGVGQPTPPHQDGYYFMLEPCAAVTMWLALEDVDEETGCVRYVTGSHRLGMRVHSRTGTLGFSQGIPDYPCPNDRVHERAFPARAGDLLVHHALTIHRADSNASRVRTRRALGFIYYADSARTDEQAHAAYKARLAQDLAADGRI